MLLANMAFADSWPEYEQSHFFYSNILTKNDNVYMPLRVGQDQFSMRLYLNTNLNSIYLMSSTCKERRIQGQCNVKNPYDFESALFYNGEDAEETVMLPYLERTWDENKAIKSANFTGARALDMLTISKDGRSDEQMLGTDIF